jgi:hypothetical protein
MIMNLLNHLIFQKMKLVFLTVILVYSILSMTFNEGYLTIHNPNYTPQFVLLKSNLSSVNPKPNGVTVPISDISVY